MSLTNKQVKEIERVGIELRSEIDKYFENFK